MATAKSSPSVLSFKPTSFRRGLELKFIRHMSVRLSWEWGSGHFTANALHLLIKESTESLCACLVAHSWAVVDFSSLSKKCVRKRSWLIRPRIYGSSRQPGIPIECSLAEGAYEKTYHQSVVSGNAPSQCLKITNMLPRGPSPVKRLQVGLFELGRKGHCFHVKGYGATIPFCCILLSSFNWEGVCWRSLRPISKATWSSSDWRSSSCREDCPSVMFFCGLLVSPILSDLGGSPCSALSFERK